MDYKNMLKFAYF